MRNIIFMIECGGRLLKIPRCTELSYVYSHVFLFDMLELFFVMVIKWPNMHQLPIAPFAIPNPGSRM
jgi:hypothetical protein